MNLICILSFLLIGWPTSATFAWGFFAHQKINYYAVFLLPPEMLVFYKPHIGYLSEHAVDPDKRRYMIPDEGPRHYLDIDRYGSYPYDSLPRAWTEAVSRYGEDSLNAHGTVPWWILVMKARLTKALAEKDVARILRLSAEIGHYLADAHVPLHASSNHNGQHTGQRGIHGFWESRLPELFADAEWDLLTGKAAYLRHPQDFIWKRVLESAAAADTVLRLERELTARYAPDAKYAFEYRNGVLVRQYSTAFSRAYQRLLGDMPERRMRASIHAIASFWYTCWVDAGQPDLGSLTGAALPPELLLELEQLNAAWRGGKVFGRKEEEE